jgi:hypothetical protein
VPEAHTPQVWLLDTGNISRQRILCAVVTSSCLPEAPLSLKLQASQLLVPGCCWWNGTWSCLLPDPVWHSFSTLCLPCISTRQSTMKANKQIHTPLTLPWAFNYLWSINVLQLHAFERPAVATELILKCKHFCHYKEELCGFRIRRLKIQPTTIDPCRNPIPRPATTLRTLLCSTFTIDEGHKSNPTAVTARKLIHTQDHSCASLAYQWMGPSARP